MTQPWSYAAAASFLVSALVAALLPLQDQTAKAIPALPVGFPGWPLAYDGHPLQPMPLARRELALAQDFPGRVGRFTDGRREIILRWVGAPTRRLHPAADCFRASGYAIAALPPQRDGRGAPMGCFRARRGDESLKVCELIRDAQGQSWPDVSAWYWHALLGTSTSPWWSLIVAEPG